MLLFPFQQTLLSTPALGYSKYRFTIFPVCVRLSSIPFDNTSHHRVQHPETNHTTYIPRCNASSSRDRAPETQTSETTHHLRSPLSCTSPPCRPLAQACRKLHRAFHDGCCSFGLLRCLSGGGISSLERGWKGIRAGYEAEGCCSGTGISL
jgi:hypothetical protein